MPGQRTSRPTARRLLVLTPVVALLCAAPFAALQASAQAPAAPASPTAPASASELSALIDRQIERRWAEKNITPASACDDRAFVRRVYLDLIGRIPTPAETEQYLADTSAARRAALVDRLLAGPEYARRMRDVFDVVLIGRKTDGPRRRRGEGGGEFRGEWLKYLERSFAENRPWNRLVKDVLLARPENPADKGSVWFLYSRGDRYQEIAEAISPSLFGVQVQCAQCHDHPLASEIKQAHYWGLVAFFNRGKNKNTKEGPQIAESAVGGFSNFANLSGQSSPALLSFLGAKVVDEERPPDGQMPKDAPELYNPAPAGTDMPAVPKFSRRGQFVDRVVEGNPLVARAAVNRFWALLMGRGIVHPVDKMDSIHPPSHPELLDQLAADFEKSGWDVKRLVRGIVLSRAYQLDSRRVGDATPDTFSYGIEKPLTAEALYRSLLVAATGKTDTENLDLRDELVEAFPDIFVEESIATLRQTMFLSNNPLVDTLTRPAAGNTAERLAAIADPAARVKAAFQAALGRDPDAEELKQSVAYLSARADRPGPATAQLWWAILSGAEFRYNH